jgi:hypothetical protein
VHQDDADSAREYLVESIDAKSRFLSLPPPASNSLPCLPTLIENVPTPDDVDFVGPASPA